MAQIKIKISDNSEITAFNLAEKLYTLIIDLSQTNGKINIAISGGSTPNALFKVLASKFSDVIDWTLVNIFWVDERCVPPADDESNYGQAKIHFFDKLEFPEENIFRIRGEENPEDESARYSDLITGIVNLENGLPKFDIILLGIGEDGHTASIFPDQPELLNSDTICAVAVHPVSGQKRVTLTGRVINNSSEVIYFVTGEKKAGIIADIINESENAKSYPAYRIKSSNGITSFYLDKDAAGKLE